jgi:peptidoglycan/LPS O-acetylase OafA/YrhL
MPRHSETVERFRGIDGLRAWMAWTVVASHIGFFTGADATSRLLVHLSTCAAAAVLVFVIISGFVITHLLLEKHEPYPAYIARRFLRIYPVYVLCLLAGVLATQLRMATFAAHTWAATSPQSLQAAAEARSLAAHGYAVHVLAHLTLLHGAIPDSVLGVSQYMFLGPAWSLSLEWQFYLVAPLILLCLGTRSRAVLLALVTVAGFAACRLLGHRDFVSPSLLPAAGPYFALGMATRLIYPRLPSLATYPFVSVILAGALAMTSQTLLPCLVWVAFVAWMRLRSPSDLPSVALDRVLAWTLDSGPARYLGERSYSTYLVHEPIVHALIYVCVVRCGFGLGSTFPVVLALTPLLTLAVSGVLFGLVERPSIDLGKRLFAAGKKGAGGRSYGSPVIPPPPSGLPDAPP